LLLVLDLGGKIYVTVTTCNSVWLITASGKIWWALNMVISAKTYFQFGDSVPQPKKWHQCNNISFMVDAGSLLLKAKGSV